MISAAKTDFKGGCHCGSARFTLALAVSDPPKAVRCNCTICVKSGWTPVLLESLEDFKLQQPASEKDLLDYQNESGTTHRLICPKCAIHLYSYGYKEFGGKRHDFFSVNLLSLDQPQEGLEFSNLKIQYWDGRHDNWKAGPKDTPWPCGTI
jgi:hypothetical protein